MKSCIGIIGAVIIGVTIGLGLDLLLALFFKYVLLGSVFPQFGVWDWFRIILAAILTVSGGSYAASKS